MTNLRILSVVVATYFGLMSLAAAQAPAPAQSVTLLPGSNSHEPINIAADKLDYFDKEQKAIYSGNVVVVQGETRLNATILTVLFDKKTGTAKNSGQSSSGSQLRRMEGKGPITIVNRDQVGIGDALVYDKIENKFYLRGNVSLSQGENITRGDTLVYDLTSGQAVVSSAGRVRSRIVPGDKAAQEPAAPKTRPGH